VLATGLTGHCSLFAYPDGSCLCRHAVQTFLDRKPEPRLATPNYSYEKRQRELAKKRKNEDKRQRKLHPQPEDGRPAQDRPESPTSDTTNTPGSNA
jgi:hypothetical protein